MWSAAFWAASRSGEPFRPTEKEWSLDIHDEAPSPFAFRVNVRCATDATKEESNPPDSKTPQGTSLIIRRSTAFTKASRSFVKSHGVDGRTPDRQVGAYHKAYCCVSLLQQWPGLNCSTSGQSLANDFISDAIQTDPSLPLPKYNDVIPI